MSSEPVRPPEDPRLRFAAERTLLAWVRTGLGLMGFGFVVARFGLFLREIEMQRGGNPSTPRGSLWIGAGLVLLGVAVALLAAREHFRILRQLERGEAYRAPKWSLGITVALLLAVIGVGMVVYLFTR